MILQRTEAQRLIRNELLSLGDIGDGSQRRAAELVERIYGGVAHTSLGPIKVMPECRTQAVCVNGNKCWEVGHCLGGPNAR